MLYGHDEGKNIKQLNDGSNDVVCIKMGGTGASTAAGARNNILEGEPLPIAEGGTGATTAPDARSNLGLSGAETKTLLWTNASPTSSFASQTLTIANLSAYDGVMIIFSRHTTVKMFNDTDMVDNSGYIGVDTSKNRYINGRATKVTPSSNAIEIGDNIETTLKSNTVSNATKNANCIPLKIYGIKEV